MDFLGDDLDTHESPSSGNSKVKRVLRMAPDEVVATILFHVEQRYILAMTNSRIHSIIDRQQYNTSTDREQDTQ